MKVVERRKTNILILGAILGALSGIGAAYLLLQRAEREGREVRLSSGEGLRLGMLIMGTLRQIAQIGTRE